MSNHNHRDKAAQQPLDDQGLLEALQRGGDRAAALIYDCFSADISRMVWRLLGADADHGDLVNEVFVQVLSGIRGVKKASSLRSWVLSVTVNTVNGELRRRTKQRRYVVGQDLQSIPSPQLPDHEDRALLRHAYALLDRMPPKERIPFCLRYLDEQPLEQVARLSGCSLATAKRRIKAAERRLAALMRRDPELVQLFEGDAAGASGS